MCGSTREPGTVVSGVYPDLLGGADKSVFRVLTSWCSLLFTWNPLPCLKRLLWKIHLLLPILGLESISCIS